MLTIFGFDCLLHSLQEERSGLFFELGFIILIWICETNRILGMCLKSGLLHSTRWSTKFSSVPDEPYGCPCGIHKHEGKMRGVTKIYCKRLVESALFSKCVNLCLVGPDLELNEYGDD